ncbi:MAG: folate-binding protein YgfZ [Actinobacteria bacterium]|nr:folate-binding protein YgfZ [Actinomycetota bacterium]
MTAVYVEDGLDKGAIWHFGEVAKEQRELSAGKTWADLSHRAVIAISGEDRLTWLHSLTTQHLEKLAAGEWREALILDPQGHIEQQLFLVDDGTTTYLHLDREKVAPLLGYLEKMKFMLRVDAKDVSNEFAILKAPGKTDLLGGPYALVPRGELVATINAFNTSNLQVGTWALEAERVATGKARLGIDTDHKTIPNEIGALNRSVHMAKGCYRGQETVAKVFNLGHPPRRLVLLHLDGSSVELPKSGTPVTYDGKEIGFIGTIARHYELGTIALALIKRMTPADAVLNVGGIAATQEILVPVE